jgi:hypothetical protein
LLANGFTNPGLGWLVGKGEPAADCTALCGLDCTGDEVLRSALGNPPFKGDEVGPFFIRESVLGGNLGEGRAGGRGGLEEGDGLYVGLSYAGAVGEPV